MKNKRYAIVVSYDENMLYIVERKNALRVAEFLCYGNANLTIQELQDELDDATKLKIPFDMTSENPLNIIFPLTFANPRKM